MKGMDKKFEETLVSLAKLAAAEPGHSKLEELETLIKELPEPNEDGEIRTDLENGEYATVFLDEEKFVYYRKNSKGLELMKVVFNRAGHLSEVELDGETEETP